jgi:hypothetical protein
MRLEDELLEEARQEQRRQLQALAKERRERARRIDERARLSRIEQLKWMTEQEDKSNERAVRKQLKALQVCVCMCVCVLVVLVLHA